jgi:hypothetical protein
MRDLRWFLALGVVTIAAACGGSADTGFSPEGGEGSGDGALGDGAGGSGGDGSGSGSGFDGGGDGTVGTTDGGGHGPDGSSGSSGGDGSSASDAPADVPVEAPCNDMCSTDLQSVVDCHSNVVKACAAGSECDVSQVACISACQAAIDNKQYSGCEFYATAMDQWEANTCFAAYVANTWTSASHLTVTYNGTTLPIANFARIPSGSGTSITYGAYSATTGLAPGEVAILFLSGGGTGSAVPCPSGVTTAMPTGAQIIGASGLGNSFQITSDVPVVAYEIDPYGGGSAAITGASLLLPTSTWDLNYVGVTVSPHDIGNPSMNIIASQNGTSVTINPVAAIAGGGGLAAGAANAPYTFTLNAGQMAQFSQPTDLNGSTISATKPIGLMAGQSCMREPVGVAYCDHGEQMVPPTKAMGTQYVAVMNRPRVAGDAGIWHLVGAANGTQLTYSSAVGGPATLNAGQSVDFITATPFVVTSQDAQHPFMLFQYMSGSQWTQLSNTGGYGDPDFVLSVPPSQYLDDYVFFVDPTYPEGDLVVVRALNGPDVTLDCAGTLTGWQTVGNFQWTRADLITGNFANVGSCSTGRHEMKSTGKFGLWVWGWGTPLTSSFTANVSYGYPAGMNVQKVNSLLDHPVQ